MKTVFVTVGTTSFDELVESITCAESVQDPDEGHICEGMTVFCKALQARGYERLVLQVGRGSLLPAADSCPHVRLEAFRFKDSIAEDIKQADLVISHAGAGSCLESLCAGKPLLVVVNDKLMDNHQLELARQLHMDSHLLYCTVQVIVNGEKERVSLLFMKALVSTGSVDAVSQQMASHPQYLESFLRTQHYILHMDGPLPLPYRHYIAIMVSCSSGHHCNYLVYLHSAQFLRVGGDPLWLQGLEAAPPRLRLLDHINKVLAHQPWLTACSHIQTLLKSGEQCWSLAELVQAVVILAHCHSLCSFVFGCDTDSDFVPLSKSPNGTPPTFCPFDAANGNTNVPQSLATPSEHKPRRRDYSWEDHGFSLVNRLYSDIGHLLDDRFRSVTTLPSLHSPDLKRAIWNYIHCVLGIRYDDYDYGEVNQLLERDLKLYIKAVACFPDATKTPVCPLSWAPLKTSERIHVNLLIMEARLQAELLYALRAITQYMIA
ncbi:Sestrin-1 [Collichthys lucidus]|uniref:Sestrin-1 n=1 Tax=Collichthys lucidus TaxID=240159 RepID=A0A4U5UFY1_COLLU|nr:Sestrin-1 [Collichthys lucidus]